MKITLDHFNIVVEDMARAVAFYCEVFGFQQTFEATLEGEWIARVTGLPNATARCVFLQLPACDVRLELLEYSIPQGAKIAKCSDANTVGLRHFALETDDMDALIDRLKAARVEFVSPPVEVPFAVGDRGTKRLCYFHDPDGVLLEVASYSSTRNA